jgi:hypothetical protein
VSEDQDFQIRNGDCFVCPFNFGWDSFGEEIALWLGLVECFPEISYRLVEGSWRRNSVFEQFIRHMNMPRTPGLFRCHHSFKGA